MGSADILKGVGLHRADALAVDLDIGNSIALIRSDGEGLISALADADIARGRDGTVSTGSCLDGVVAVLGAFYKAVNTMDSMVGYKNEKYLYFGRFAAKVDDVLNYIPARLSALFMVAAAGLTGLSAKNAWKIFKRDRYNHASPNSAQTEAAMAGALGVQLAGDAWYFGTLYKKKTIGDALRPVECEDIRRANRLMYASAGLLLIVVMLLYCSFNILTLL